MQVEVYAFGSFFRNSSEPNDIDLVLVHEDISIESCRFAAICKSALRAVLSDADITLLSQIEEAELNFLDTCRARHLGLIGSGAFDRDMLAITQRIEAAAFQTCK